MEITPENFIFNVATSLAVAAVIAVLGLIARRAMKRFDRDLAPFLGDYRAYHLVLSKDSIVTWGAKFERHWLGLKMTLEEEGEAKYAYEGKLRFRGNVFYCSLEAKTHEAEAFLVGQNPFNKSKPVDSFFGILCGINQEINPASAKLLFSRYVLSDAQVRLEFSDSQSAILVSQLPTNERLKSASGASKVKVAVDQL